MKVIVLEGREFKTVSTTHEILMEKMDLPTYYGKNLDALFDCLTGYIETPVLIQWKDFEISKTYLGEYAEELKLVFLDASLELDELQIEFL